MLELTTCPGCQAELAAPPSANLASADLTPARLECPLCGTHFAIQGAKQRRIPAAKLAKPAPLTLPTLPPREPTPALETVEQVPTEIDPAERETVFIPRQQSPTLEQLPLELPAKPAPVPQPRATVEREVAETVELPPLASELVQEPAKEPAFTPATRHELPSEPVVAKEPPALPSLKLPLSAEPKSPLTKLADLLDTPQLRPFVAPPKAASPAPLSAKPQATAPQTTALQAAIPQSIVTKVEPAPSSNTKTKTIEFSSTENDALLTRDFEFDLSTPDDSVGFNPFDAQPPEEATVEVAATDEDPTELGWALSRRLRNAAIVTMFTSACALGFLAFRPAGSAPVEPNDLTTTAESPVESNLLAGATELLNPRDQSSETAAPRTDTAVEPAAFAAEEPPAPITPAEPTSPLSGAPTYTAEDLVAALEGATEARTHLQSHTLGDAGEVAALGRNYARLCYLAQVYALLSDEAAADSLRDRLLARDQFSLLFESTRARSEVSKIAGPWIAWKNKPHGGVFFCGTLPNPIRHGELFEYPFELTPGQVLPVLLDEAADPEQFGRADSSVAAVIGVLVENPADRLPGYTGSAPQAVWCRELLPLREARLE